MRQENCLDWEIRIEGAIQDFVLRFSRERETRWRKALVGFASAQDLRFELVKQVAAEDHAAPSDLLPGAVSVISWFVPFHPSIPESNRYGRYASREWALAYVETNQLIENLSLHLQTRLEKNGYHAAVIRPTHVFDRKRLVSRWSHRHVAWIAGLGQFGHHNLLITEKGCCGRIGSLVTDLPLAPTAGSSEPACLSRAGKTCLVCVEHCVADALKPDGFDRFRCYAMCLENEVIHKDLGSADVCGKCAVGLPCSFVNPMKNPEKE